MSTVHDRANVKFLQEAKLRVILYIFLSLSNLPRQRFCPGRFKTLGVISLAIFCHIRNFTPKEYHKQLKLDLWALAVAYEKKIKVFVNNNNLVNPEIVLC